MSPLSRSPVTRFNVRAFLITRSARVSPRAWSIRCSSRRRVASIATTPAAFARITRPAVLRCLDPAIGRQLVSHLPTAAPSSPGLLPLHQQKPGHPPVAVGLGGIAAARRRFAEMAQDQPLREEQRQVTAERAMPVLDPDAAP